MKAEELLRRAPLGLINWIDFDRDAKGLCICLNEEDSAENVFADYLSELGMSVNRIIVEDILAEMGYIPWEEKDPGKGKMPIMGKADGAPVLPPIEDRKPLKYDYPFQAAVNAESENYFVEGATYDYIFAINILEKTEDPALLLNWCEKKMKASGELFFSMENALGSHYFCGDLEVGTGRVFEGIEGYLCTPKTIKEKAKDRLYTKAEVDLYLDKLGLKGRKYYSVFSKNTYPNLIVAENYNPDPDFLQRKVKAIYNSSETLFMNENILWPRLLENNLLHQMANGYLVICSKSEPVQLDVLQVELSPDRECDRNIITITRSDCVEKRALYNSGAQGLVQTYKCAGKMSELGIRSVVGMLQGDFSNVRLESRRYRKTDGDDYGVARINREGRVMDIIRQEDDIDEFSCAKYKYFLPRIQGECLLNKWKRDAYLSLEVLKEDVDCFVQYVMSYCNGEHIFFDMIPSNCVWTENGFLFVNQEHCIGNGSFLNDDFIQPASMMPQVMLYRIYLELYESIPNLSGLFHPYEFREKYGVADEEQWNACIAQNRSFNRGELYENASNLRRYYDKHEYDAKKAECNRKSMSWNLKKYEQVFNNIFSGLDRKKLILFGSGRFAERFYMAYGDRYPIYAVIDNDKAMHEKNFHGALITGMDYLQNLSPAEYKIIICIKNYDELIKQLDESGVVNYSVYIPGVEYPDADYIWLLKEKRKGKLGITNTFPDGREAIKEQKKFGIGYVAGVFDLFHIGHLNLLRRAKEQCDYLVVGISSDEWVFENKRKKTYVSTEDRMEIVSACKYVDEVLEIPYEKSSIRDMYEKVRFDAMFTGDDHSVNPNWQADCDYLKNQGAELVIFGYTQGISSTQIQANLNK